jgi:CDP-glycerol glycerophosphotransferase (TagB/SpsB family)
MGLLPPLEVGTQRRALDASILDSDFITQWTAFLSSPALAAAADRHGVRIGFLPHPNMQPLLTSMALPEHVQPLTYEGVDVQEYFARARVFVTDFSSVAFNAAYLGRPVVYFQFDEEAVLGGAHVGKRGYFDYRRDGFGPVETQRDAAVDAVAAALAHGPGPTVEHQQRIDAAFPERDGGCSERVVRAIRRSVRNRSVDPVEPTPVQPNLPEGVTP